MSKATKAAVKAAVRKPSAPAKSVKTAAVPAARPSIKPLAPQPKVPTKGQQRQAARNEADVAALKAADEGYKLARENAVKYLYSRRQAIFALARHFHLDADDLQQEAYEVLLTCLRDFNPLYTKADGSTVTVQFNTFFGNRLEGKALEQRNRDPEYQARQAHLQDMSDEERSEFRKNPPLLVQHLDQETTMQETLRGEVASAQRSRQTNLALKVVQDTFIERKLNDLIAAERDDKRRAALMHVKVGGVSSFEEIAYHFGVTDSRASQILNELMDAFYVQRLIDGDLKSVMYDFRKLSLQPKRTQRLLEEAMRNAPSPRAVEIANLFMGEYPELREVLGSLPKPGQMTDKTDVDGMETSPTMTGTVSPAQLTPAEEDQFPLQAVEWHEIATLTALGVQFRPAPLQAPEDMAHIRQIAAHPAETWPPLVITPEGGVIDGERRIAAARAKGITRLLCQVRTVPSAALAKQLRVCLNSRVRPLDKLELYFAIGALSELGLTQGVIAQALGTSRPNVIVYAKVREKASLRLRQLFEDGLIQITNASSAVDLPVQSQDEMADFIRQYGAGWGRGPQFNELYAAAAEGQIAALVPPQMGGGPQPAHAAILPLPSIPAPAMVTAPMQGAQLVAPPGSLSPTLATALKKRQEALETALRDSEIWARQREATIASQTGQIHDLRQQVESYKRELEAQTLLQHGDAATMANYMKELKAFYAVQERIASAIYQLEKTQTAVRSLNLTHRQTVELEQLLEKVATLQTALRVQLVKTPTSTPESTR